MTQEVAAVCAELAQREPIFHHPELSGTTRADFEASTVGDFWEVGASGTVYEREYVWEILDQRYHDPTYVDEWAATDFFCRKLGEHNYLLTYVLHEGERVTRRATVWRRGEQTWQVVYHQGTIVHDA
jgi:hypothetical protein